jgi:hypothetical protein
LLFLPPVAAAPLQPTSGRPAGFLASGIVAEAGLTDASAGAAAAATSKSRSGAAAVTSVGTAAAGAVGCAGCDGAAV